MNIEHSSRQDLRMPSSGPPVFPHLYPFSSQLLRRPLPPLFPPDHLDATRTKLFDDVCGRLFQEFGGNRFILGVHPNRMWDILRGEGLQLLDGVLRCVDQELPDELYTFVVRETSFWCVF